LGFRVGDDLVIHLDDGDRIIIEDMLKANFDNNDLLPRVTRSPPAPLRRSTRPDSVLKQTSSFSTRR